MNLTKQIALLKRQWRKRRHTEYNVFENGLLFFQEFADIYGDSIDTLDKFELFMDDFMTETKGQVIVDMLDADNWDCIRGYSIEKDAKILYLYWQMKESDAEKRLLRQMAFPLDVYGLAIRLKNVQFIKDKKGRCFAICINGYTIPDSDINKRLKKLDPKKSMIDADTSFFSTNYVRVDQDPSEDMRIMKTPIKSFWLIPKCLNIHAQKSKDLLYELNLHECECMLEEAIEDLQRTINHHKRNKARIEKAIKVAGNQIRQADENLFKLVMCFYQKEFKFKAASYNDNLLGKVISPLKKHVYSTEDYAIKLNKIADVANKCSHYTGLPVELSELMELYLYTKFFIGDFRIRIQHNEIFVDTPVNSVTMAEKPSPFEYLKDNYKSINYAVIVSPHRTVQSGSISFFISAKIHGTGLPFLYEGNVLCQDGCFRYLKQEDLCQTLLFWNRQEVIKAKESLIDYLSKECIKNGYEGEKLWQYITFAIHARKVGRPKHLFTEAEIKAVMEKGDDSMSNRLVIDENGYPMLIQDIDNGYLYPVYQEAWGAEENAIGPNSTLSQCHDSYVSCMNCWLAYLENGMPVYADMYYSDANIDEVIEKVKILN